MGFPVILKGLAPAVPHRSDVGLVSGRISDEHELEKAFNRIQANLEAFVKSSAAVSIERYLPHDLEVILGVKQDATFGPVILCGLGGVFAEVLKDYSLRLAPLSERDAATMLESLKAYPVLKKTRAIDSLKHQLLRVSELAVELREHIEAVDINPVGFSSDSGDATVLDAKIHLTRVGL
jgi:acetyltransferase